MARLTIAILDLFFTAAKSRAEASVLTKKCNWLDICALIGGSFFGLWLVALGGECRAGQPMVPLCHFAEIGAHLCSWFVWRCSRAPMSIRQSARTSTQRVRSDCSSSVLAWLGDRDLWRAPPWPLSIAVSPCWSWESLNFGAAKTGQTKPTPRAGQCLVKNRALQLRKTGQQEARPVNKPGDEW